MELSRRRGVGLVLLAGDVFHAPDPPLGARLALEKALAAWREMGARVFIAPGNHDPWLPGGVWPSWPQGEGLTIFSPQAQGVDLAEHGLWVAGAAHASADESRDLSQALPPPALGTPGPGRAARQPGLGPGSPGPRTLCPGTPAQPAGRAFQPMGPGPHPHGPGAEPPSPGALRGHAPGGPLGRDRAQGSLAHLLAGRGQPGRVRTPGPAGVLRPAPGGLGAGRHPPSPWWNGCGAPCPLPAAPGPRGAARA